MMKGRRPPRLAIALLEQLLPGNDPLAGDLLEEWRERSDAWLWRQLLFAVLTRTIVHVRTKPRVTIESALIATALLAVLGFQSLVAASLVNRLLVLSDSAWMLQSGRFQSWQIYFAIPTFVAAVLAGRAIGRLSHHRVAAALACSVSATAVTYLNLYLFVPDVLLKPLVPDPAIQTAVGMVFIAGLFVGVSSRSTCESLPSS
jgi:hypothetical protein